MTQEEYLLIVLAEECAEVAQRCSKALRFGMEEIQPGQPLTNRERIMYELNDLLATAQQVMNGELVFDTAQCELKRQKLQKYMEYSETPGILRK